MDSFENINRLIKKFQENKESNNVEVLQSIREDLSINFFLLSDALSSALSLYERYEHERKIKTAERMNYYRDQKYTISESENLARIDAKEEAIKASQALQKKEKARIIISAIPQILNSISSRINLIN